MTDESAPAIVAIDSEMMAQQLKTEFAILEGVERSLRLALQWMTRDRGNGHKLSTLRFAARSFERHLTRTRVLADRGGYMQAITSANPHLANDVCKLAARRSELGDKFEEIILQLEYVSPDDANAFTCVCGALESYLDALEKHSHEEVDLLQHSFVVEGGEG